MIKLFSISGFRDSSSCFVKDSISKADVINSSVFHKRMSVQCERASELSEGNRKSGAGAGEAGGHALAAL